MKFRPSLRLEGPVRTLVSAEVAPDLMAVLSESLSNASRHAEATAVDVVLTVGDQVSLSVTDDGRGFGEEVSESGLRYMRERALKHGGTFTVTSSAGQGTTVCWQVPVTGPSSD
jgi:signal transduction histidine kinase